MLWRNHVVTINNILFKDGASNEGIFRMSGEGLRIKELKKAFNTQLATEVVLDPSESVHNISNLMKIFLRELEDSLIPIRYFDELKAIAGKFTLELTVKMELTTLQHCLRVQRL